VKFGAVTISARHAPCTLTLVEGWRFPPSPASPA
jgi:hypothetical protein